MKKALLLLLTIVTLGYFAAPLSAQTVWDGTADISWFDVSQTSFDISTPEQLAGVASLVNSGSTTFNGVTLNLTNDLWLNAENDSTNNWIPIGGSATATTEAQSSGNSFQGAFNGHGHSIYNLYCDKTNYFHAGFFGCIQNPCTIDSVVFINPTVKSCGMMGVIAGMTRSGGAINIRYCLVINANVVGTPAGGSSPSASHNNIGCIVGANYPNTSGTTILNCGATGNVSGYYAGGLGGNSQYETFTNCYFAGYINNYNNETGGITAYSGTRNNCYSYRETLLIQRSVCLPVRAGYHHRIDDCLREYGDSGGQDGGDAVAGACHRIGGSRRWAHDDALRSRSRAPYVAVEAESG